MTRVGLIGAGNISTTHARALAGLAGVNLAAVYAPRLEQARAVADSAGARACDDLDRFFEGQPLDMVVVGTPSGVHGEHAAAAARRGIHVLVRSRSRSPSHASTR